MYEPIEDIDIESLTSSQITKLEPYPSAAIYRNQNVVTNRQRCETKFLLTFKNGISEVAPH